MTAQQPFGWKTCGRAPDHPESPSKHRDGPAPSHRQRASGCARDEGGEERTRAARGARSWTQPGPGSRRLPRRTRGYRGETPRGDGLPRRPPGAPGTAPGKVSGLDALRHALPPTLSKLRLLPPETQGRRSSILPEGGEGKRAVPRRREPDSGENGWHRARHGPPRLNLTASAPLRASESGEQTRAELRILPRLPVPRHQRPSSRGRARDTDHEPSTNDQARRTATSEGPAAVTQTQTPFLRRGTGGTRQGSRGR